MSVKQELMTLVATSL